MLLDFALTELLLAKDYTPQTAQRRDYALRAFIRWADGQGITDIEGVTAGIVRRYLAHLRERPNQRWGEQLAGETQHSHAAILQMFLRFAVREGWLDERVVAYFDMPKRPQKVIQVFTRHHYSLLLKACDACYVPWLRLRDKTLLSVLVDTG
ncbi:MAG TPA: site-specific integrase, partial [Ktedonobacterales bacterium]|nr:site-specific integrase [Ktedonobacterales bacterium]